MKKINCNNKIYDKKNYVIVFFVLVIIAYIIYYWTIKLPIIGDGLMHMSDHIDLTKPINWIKTFFTLDGVGKEREYVLNVLYRPIFNDFIVPIVKSVTNENTVVIRCISILMLAIDSFLIYVFAILKNSKKYIAFLGSLVFAFSFTYFLPIFEYGVSFSIWMTFFFMLSLIFVEKAIITDKKSYFILSIIFSFFTIFTKESAIMVGIALSIYMLIEECFRKKISKKTFLFITIEAIITLVYIILRIKRLGSIFSIAGGIEVKMTLANIVKKIVGYFLYVFNIPTKVNFFEFMISTLKVIPILLSVIMVMCFTIIVLYITVTVIKNPIKEYKVIMYIFTFVLLISPTFKVGRSGVYYSDLAIIPVISLLVYLANKVEDKNKYFKNVFVVTYILVFCTMIMTMEKYNLNTYINGTNKAYDLEMQINKMPKYKYILQADSFIGNEDRWIFNQGKIGAFYNSNIDKEAIVKQVSEEEIEKFDNEKMLIDYSYELENRENYKIFCKMNNNNDTKVLKINYNSSLVDDDNSSQIIRYNYEYEGKRYENVIDISYRKQSGAKDYVYVVIPTKSDLVIDSNSKRYIIDISQEKFNKTRNGD